MKIYSPDVESFFNIYEDCFSIRQRQNAALLAAVELFQTEDLTALSEEDKLYTRLAFSATRVYDVKNPPQESSMQPLQLHKDEEFLDRIPPKLKAAVLVFGGAKDLVSELGQTARSTFLGKKVAITALKPGALWRPTNDPHVRIPEEFAKGKIEDLQLHRGDGPLTNMPRQLTVAEHRFGRSDISHHGDVVAERVVNGKPALERLVAIEFIG